jgi:hypothetical protein
MITRELTLVISAKIETDLDAIEKVLMLTLNNDSMRLQSNSTSSNQVDWNAEVETTAPNFEEYYQLADELYSKLINNSSAFNDWEYKFITDMYSYSIEKKTYSEKQRGWIRKMRDKYLD